MDTQAIPVNSAWLDVFEDDVESFNMYRSIYKDCEVDFSNKTYGCWNIKYADFSGAKMVSSGFKEGLLYRCNFKDADLTDFDVRGNEVIDCNFLEARKMDGLKFRRNNVNYKIVRMEEGEDEEEEE